MWDRDPAVPAVYRDIAEKFVSDLRAVLAWIPRDWSPPFSVEQMFAIDAKYKSLYSGGKVSEADIIERSRGRSAIAKEAIRFVTTICEALPEDYWTGESPLDR